MNPDRCDPVNLRDRKHLATTTHNFKIAHKNVTLLSFLPLTLDFPETSSLSDASYLLLYAHTNFSQNLLYSRYKIAGIATLRVHERYVYLSKLEDLNWLSLLGTNGPRSEFPFYSGSQRLYSSPPLAFLVTSSTVSCLFFWRRITLVHFSPPNRRAFASL